MDEKCKQVFQLVAASGGEIDTVRKEDLVRAHKGEDEIFEEMDLDSSGDITLLEWMKFIRVTVQAKGAQGQEWLQSWLTLLRTNVSPSNRGWSSSGGSRGSFPPKGSTALAEYQVCHTWHCYLLLNLLGHKGSCVTHLLRP